MSDGYQLEELARRTYKAYGESTGNKNFRGEEMPEFDALPDSIKAAWKAACREVWNLFWKENHPIASEILKLEGRTYEIRRIPGEI